MTNELVFGIDLGTTFSSIAFVRDGKVEVVAHEGETIMPSVVGFDASGALLVGTPAKNQLAAYPERTLASVKRLMGNTTPIQLGDHTLTPPEVSALILKELARRARIATGQPVEKVVITVPAFFGDAERQATKAAGEIAGLEVLRLLHEPTAASLAFEGDAGGTQRLLAVYDLGGGTFDVSIVATDGKLTEVLASHGDVHLGGDDFDRVIAEELARQYRSSTGHDPLAERVALARLLRAAELGKRRLTEEVSTRIREEFLGTTKNGEPAHLDEELTRARFEELITPFVERTIDSVHEALRVAKKSMSDLDDVLLVGGMTRAPIIAARLTALFGRPPRRDVHPDLCVAQGAAILAARLCGQEVGRVLVDVSTHSIGPRALGERHGHLSEHCFAPVIPRGTPLPVTRSESFYTVHDDQEAWDVCVYQGESDDVRENVLIGRFLADGFTKAKANSEIVCKMTLDLDGVLLVEAIQKSTGKKKQLRIEATGLDYSAEHRESARVRSETLWSRSASAAAEPAVLEPAPRSPAAAVWVPQAQALIARGAGLLGRMANEDRAEFESLAAGISAAIADQNESAWEEKKAELENLVHYVEEA